MTGRKGDRTCKRRALRFFLRSEGGASAVEFGLIGMMFFLLIGMWIELGLMVFMQTTLDHAVRKESRLIRTGQITASQASVFKTALCNDIAALMKCDNVQINVVSGPSFASLSNQVPTDATSHMTTTGFFPGASGSDVVVQVGYTRPITFALAAPFIGKNSAQLVYSSVSFQNEAF